MRHIRDWRTALLLGTCLNLCPPIFAQIRNFWFDINPSQSNDGRNGASGGRVNHLGAASDFSKVYAASEWGGLYQSFDQGNTWVKINTFTPSATWDVKVDPSNSSKVYATSFFDGRVNPNAGISVSNDAGATWNPVNFAKSDGLNCTNALNKTQPSAWQISINPGTPSTVFVGTNCGLARSLDSGGSWTFIEPVTGGPGEQIFSVVAQSPQIVDVIGNNGHFRSTDNGATWSAIGAPPGPVAGNSGTASTMAASPRENYVLFAGAGSTNIFESDDGGATWPTSLNLPLQGGGVTNVQGRIPFLKTNQLSTSSQFDLWYGDIHLFKETATTPSTQSPGGAPRAPLNSWADQQDGAHDDNGDVLFDPRFASGACPALFSGDGSIFRNTNGLNPGCQGPNWTQPNITPHATWLWAFDGQRLSPGTHALTYGLQDDGGYAANNVQEGFSPPIPSWNTYTCCDIMINEEGPGEILSLEGFFSTGRNFQLFTRNQDGSNSNQIANYPSPQPVPAFVNGKDAFPLPGNGFVLNMADGVYFTNNILAGSISWTSLNAPTAATSSVGNVKVATFNGAPNIFYHTGNGNPESQGVIFRSGLATGRLAGSNWIPLPLPANIGTVNAYDVDPTNGNHIIISGINNLTGNFQIFLTQDFGGTWNELNNLENLMLGVGPAGGAPVFLNQSTQGRTTGFLSFGTYWQPSLFKFDPLDPSTIVAGAIDAGVFVSLDNGGSWGAVSNNINPTSQSPGIPAPIFAYFSPGRFNASTTDFDVWVGTRGAGVRKVVLETP